MKKTKSVSFLQLNITTSQVLEVMGYRKNRIPEQIVMDLVESYLCQAKINCKPSYTFRLLEGQSSANGFIISPFTFKTGRIIARALQGSEYFALFVATAGMEFHHWMESASKDVLEQYIMDSIGSVIAEAVTDFMQQEIEDAAHEKGLRPTNRYSPGYCGWQVSEQQALFTLMEEDTARVCLTDSHLMVPVKSVSGVIGIGSQVTRQAYGCEICNSRNCFRRKS